MLRMKGPGRILKIIGPGLLVAATGVGAGDLATGALTGSRLGVAILWVVLAGAFLKFVLNEGLTRWQLATGETLIDGSCRLLGRKFGFLFLLYFLVWSFLVAAALMSACGAAASAIFPIFKDPGSNKICYGLLHSAIGLTLVRLGGFRVFERLMGACIALMFLTVVVTAVLLAPGASVVLQGMFLPTIPQFGQGGLEWVVALTGGVGGTVTMLCYGYWIREEGRTRIEDLAVCRIDLATGYLVTALFGMAMVIVGSTVEVSGSGVGLIVGLADRLASELGPVAKGCFLLGAWSAVTSSLLGVWQSVPYLFSDLWRHCSPGETSERSSDPTRERPYIVYLYLLSTVPAIGLWWGFARMQKAYAMTGALFLPILALALLLLNSGRGPLPPQLRNRPLTVVVLGATLVFFLLFSWFVIF